MPTVGVVAKFTIQAGKADEFATVANEWLVTPSQSEAGCIRYELWQDNEDPTLFAMVEEWESNEALDAHLAGSRTRTGGPNMGDYMAPPRHAPLHQDRLARAERDLAAASARAHRLDHLVREAQDRLGRGDVTKVAGEVPDAELAIVLEDLEPLL